FAAFQHLAPREHGVAGEQRRDMTPAVDRRDMKGVRETVERQRAGERNDMPAVNEPATEAALRAIKLIEMHTRRVLIESRCDLVRSFIDRHAVAMVDLLARLVILETPRAAGEHIIVAIGIELRQRAAERFYVHMSGKL